MEGETAGVIFLYCKRKNFWPVENFDFLFKVEN